MRGLLAVLVVSVLLTLSEGRAAPHIIGGRDARPGEFPYQGSLQRFEGRTSGKVNLLTGHICGCVLISDTWLVTAAHCVATGPIGLYVVMGLHIRGDASKGAPAGYSIKDIISHPQWDRQTLSNDIALIELNTKVKLNKFVEPVGMAPQGANYDGQMCNISGWGVITMGGGSLSRVLQVAEVKVMPLPQCNDIWGSVDKTHICVGVPFEKGACNGDSGGPLVCGGRLAGVTSFGQRGCYVDTPSVYTRISEYRDWIQRVSGL